MENNKNQTKEELTTQGVVRHQPLGVTDSNNQMTHHGEDSPTFIVDLTIMN